MEHLPWQTQLRMSVVDRKLEKHLSYFKLPKLFGANPRAQLPFAPSRILPYSIRIHPKCSSNLKSDL